jgi:DNA-binding PadR family transcriptional regulator
MLSILEYLCTNTQKMPVSKYHIVTKVSTIKQQRPDRVGYIMDALEKNGFIKSTKTPNATFYQITENGIEAYFKWIKDFLNFARFAGSENND